jgi:hypothetical protein
MPGGKYRMYLRRAKTGKPVHNYLSAETMAAVLTGAHPRGKHLFIDSLPTKENELKNAIEYFGGRFVKPNFWCTGSRGWLSRVYALLR